MVQWRKSSRSATSECVEVGWRRANRCDTGNCVEIKNSTEMVGMRDSKDPGGPELWFPADAFRDFIAAVKTGDL